MTETKISEELLDTAPPALAAVLSHPPRYEVQRSKEGKYIVIRFGPKGGKRIVQTYADTDMGQTAALTLSATLTVWADNE